MELRSPIVGNKFRPISSQERYHHLKEDEPVTLVREPENSYDENAIAVHSTDGFHLGYIPKSLNTPLATALDEGHIFNATYSAEHDRVWIVEVTF